MIFYYNIYQYHIFKRLFILSFKIIMNLFEYLTGSSTQISVVPIPHWLFGVFFSKSSNTQARSNLPQKDQSFLSDHITVIFMPTNFLYCTFNQPAWYGGLISLISCSLDITLQFDITYITFQSTGVKAVLSTSMLRGIE